MSDILRILERFNIADRGIIYIVERIRAVKIHIGDIYEDLRGNHFHVTGIEMIRSIPNKKTDCKTMGLLFAPVDEAEACGSILVKGQKRINFLFCNHPFYPQRVDDDYEEEYQQAALDHPCALFSYEDTQMGKLSLYGKEISGLTIYRGWMMTPELYHQFYTLLEEKNIVLINSPLEYERYHTLPGWYDDFKDVTPESVWETEGNLESVLNIAKGLNGSFIVKDFVKSREHEWYDACFIKNILNRENTSKIITNFINRQGSDLVGGVVLKKYENLRRIGFHEKSGMPISEEYRVFIYAGRILIVDDYWRKEEQIIFSDEEQKWMSKMANRVKSNFVTMDLARKEDGSLIIMEFGDGQVSGLQQINPTSFYSKF